MRNLLIILFAGLSTTVFSQTTISVQQITTKTIEKGDFVIYFDLDKSLITITEGNIQRVNDKKYTFTTTFYPNYRQTNFYFGNESFVFYEFDNGTEAFVYYHPDWIDLKGKTESIEGELP